MVTDGKQRREQDTNQPEFVNNAQESKMFVNPVC